MVKMYDVQVGDLLRFDSGEEFNFRQTSLVLVTHIHTGRWEPLGNHKIVKVVSPGRLDFRGVDLLTGEHAYDFAIVSSTESLWTLVSRPD